MPDFDWSKYEREDARPSTEKGGLDYARDALHGLAKGTIGTGEALSNLLTLGNSPHVDLEGIRSPKRDMAGDITSLALEWLTPGVGAFKGAKAGLKAVSKGARAARNYKKTEMLADKLKPLISADPREMKAIRELAEGNPYFNRVLIPGMEEGNYMAHMRAAQQLGKQEEYPLMYYLRQLMEKQSAEQGAGKINKYANKANALYKQSKEPSLTGKLLKQNTIFHFLGKALHAVGL